MASSPVWFITGCSTGLGRALVTTALAHGARVVATARQVQALSGLASEAERDRLLTLALDVTDPVQRERAISEACRRFGGIDVLVNNAGYGYQVTVEEGQEDQIRALFETDVFSVFALTREVLPRMRAQGRGHVLTIGSVAGLLGLPGSGYYAAAKHALEGWTDALAAEIGPLGLQASCVEPGPLRTDFAARSLRQTPTALAEYLPTAGARHRATRESSGRQPGDPQRCAEIIVRLIHEGQMPRHLVLGRAAAQMAIDKLVATTELLQGWQTTSGAADF